MEPQVQGPMWTDGPTDDLQDDKDREVIPARMILKHRLECAIEITVLQGGHRWVTDCGAQLRNRGLPWCLGRLYAITTTAIRSGDRSEGSRRPMVGNNSVDPAA